METHDKVIEATPLYAQTVRDAIEWHREQLRLLTEVERTITELAQPQRPGTNRLKLAMSRAGTEEKE